MFNGPPHELLGARKLRVVEEFGGRLNQHWLVEGGEGRYVLRRWQETSPERICFEESLLRRLKLAGWPVAPYVNVGQHEGSWWGLAEYLTGVPREPGPEEAKHRGRLLAKFHNTVASMEDLPEQNEWRRAELTLSDPEFDRLLAVHEPAIPAEIQVLRHHLELARERAKGLRLESAPSSIIHGDFATWNLLFTGDRLTGLIDFELAHHNHRLADFSLSWRGKYDDVLAGYQEVSPLSEWDMEALTPIWWAWVLEGAFRRLSVGNYSLAWALEKLRCRSPFMRLEAAL